MGGGKVDSWRGKGGRGRVWGKGGRGVRVGEVGMRWGVEGSGMRGEWGGGRGREKVELVGVV